MDENEIDITEVPKENDKDAAHAIVRAIVSIIPIAGGPALEYMKYLYTAPVEKRRDEWIRAVGTRLVECEKNISDFNKTVLATNELFITILLNASYIALRNHQQEKLYALQNAVLNTATNMPIEENLQIVFVNMIDSLTPIHLKLLAYFRDPKKWIEKNKISKISSSEIMPECKEEPGIYKKIIRDLITQDLVSEIGAVNYTFDEKSKNLFFPITTPIGNKFLDYISFAEKDW